MELTLSEAELKKLILDWAAEKWPKEFNTVKFDAHYSSVSSATLTKEEPEEESAK